MTPISPIDESIFSNITLEYLEYIQKMKSGQLGVFSTLQSISRAAELWELGIILSVAEYEPVKPETIVSQFEDILSRSTVYRKISELVRNQIFFKRADGLLQMAETYRALSILGKLSHVQSASKK